MGLHNRVTARIRLMPFTLGECEKYAEDQGLAMSRGDVAEGYMVFGGIPYYWHCLKPGLSLSQNVDAMFFAENAPLRGEFAEIYKSLFGRAEAYEKVVAALAGRQSGMTRSDIVAAVGRGIAGNLTTVLDNLECSGFTRRFRAMGKRKRDAFYQLTDNFSLFHFRFLGGRTDDPAFWQSTAQTPERSAWKGVAFERLCLQHLRQIRAALGVSGVNVEAYAWRHTPDDTFPEGAQIDLLLDRSDNVVNVCEAKYSSDIYAIDAKTEKSLMRKLAVFVGTAGTRKAVHLTMLTAFGLMRNAHSGRVQSVVTLDDLFRDMP